MTTRDALYRLIDQVPEEELESVRFLIEHRKDLPRDPLLLALVLAPEDDEPTTIEENAGAAEAWDEYRRGKFITADQMKRELGL